MLGGERVGGRHNIIWGIEWSGEKNQYEKHHGIKWPPIDHFHSTTNQKQAAAMEGSMKVRLDEREVGGEAQYYRFGGVIS